MSQFQLLIGLLIGGVLMLVVLAAILPCEGCRLRRERIARGLAKLRTNDKAQD